MWHPLIRVSPATEGMTCLYLVVGSRSHKFLLSYVKTSKTERQVSVQEREKEESLKTKKRDNTISSRLHLRARKRFYIGSRFRVCKACSHTDRHTLERQRSLHWAPPVYSFSNNPQNWARLDVFTTYPSLCVAVKQEPDLTHEEVCCFILLLDRYLSKLGNDDLVWAVIACTCNSRSIFRWSVAASSWKPVGVLLVVFPM